MMPTPFYHLNLAESLLASNRLPNFVSNLLRIYRSAFLFGNIAPDVQSLSGQAREETHFFTVPATPGTLMPWDEVLTIYPSLAMIRYISSEQAIFWAGYLCHLQADWYWVQDIYWPLFGPDGVGGTLSERIYFHNIFRAYLDEQILPNLPADTGLCLASVQPNSWVPFVEDGVMNRWQIYLAEQLKPGGVVQTVNVFAERAGISPMEFRSILENQSEMENQILRYLPPNRLTRYREQIEEESCKLLVRFLSLC